MAHENRWIFGQGKAQTTAIPGGIARICNAALTEKTRFEVPVIESASLNLKYPFGLSLSKPCAALRQAQRERFK
jgi:hypothetical protein